MRPIICRFGLAFQLLALLLIYSPHLPPSLPPLLTSSPIPAMATAHLAFHCCFLFVCFLFSELETQHLLSFYSSFPKFLNHFSPFLLPCSPPYGPSIQFMALVNGVWHHQTRRPSGLCSYKASHSGAHYLQAISFLNSLHREHS